MNNAVARVVTDRQTDRHTDTQTHSHTDTQTDTPRQVPYLSGACAPRVTNATGGT